MDAEAEPFDPKRRAVVALATVTVLGLCIATTSALRLHFAEKKRVARTHAALDELAFVTSRHRFWSESPGPGVKTIFRAYERSEKLDLIATDAEHVAALGRGEWLRDGWGQPLRFRREPSGAWRLWSVGPNGVDEDGLGDDILVTSDHASASAEAPRR